MVGVRILKRRAKTCLRLLHVLPPPALPQPVAVSTLAASGEDQHWTPFVCNVCGASNCLPQSRLTREDGRCAKCGCYGRLRSMMYAVTAPTSGFAR